MKAAGVANNFAKAMISQTLAQGYELGEIARRAGVAVDALSGDGLKMTPEILGRLCRTTKLLVKDEFCGFTENRCRLGSFYPFTLETMVREDTLENALERAFKFYSLITEDIKFELSENHSVAEITVTLARPELDRFHYLQEWWLMIWSHIPSWLIHEEIPILNVNFPHAASAPKEEYEEAYWGPCHFQQAKGSLQFPAQFLRRRIALQRDEALSVFTRPFLDLANIQGVHRAWKTLVKSKMKQCLLKTESLLSIEDLAEEFNVSSQTLRRRLEVEGISFRTLKEDVRREVILSWLADSDIPIGEVSLRAGFAERNGLTRAVRSWVGLSPTEYRHSAKAGALDNMALPGMMSLASPVPEKIGYN